MCGDGRQMPFAPSPSANATSPSTGGGNERLGTALGLPLGLPAIVGIAMGIIAFICVVRCCAAWYLESKARQKAVPSRGLIIAASVSEPNFHFPDAVVAADEEQAQVGVPVAVRPGAPGPGMVA